MKIPEKLIPTIYNVSKDVYENRLSLSEGIKRLVNVNTMNSSSARDYIYNFRYLMHGKRFSRTLNARAMEYYFEHFINDYGSAKLTNPLLALYQHIEYYEKKSKTSMLQMRMIHKKYSAKKGSFVLITNLNQLIQNINTVEYYLTEGNNNEQLNTSKLIKRGICFIAYKINKEIRFVPSKFVGYVDNTLERHIPSETDGRETNEAIDSILKSKSIINEPLEKKYLEYCMQLGIKANLKGNFGVERKYWILNLEKDFLKNLELTGEFPEGKIVERMHKTRERNTVVVQIAKDNFKKRYGKLFCEACGFDFEKKYGLIGKDFIEGHHTIAVSEMKPDHKTKPQDIAMLCGNCHRMVHKKRPWLSIKDLKKLVPNSSLR